MYYQGSSEIQGDGLQTLYLMNPNFAGAGYSESQQQEQQQQQQPPTANMVILNYAAAAAAAAGGQISFPGQQHLVGVPLHQAAASNIGSSGNNNNSSNDLKLINHLSMDSSQNELSSPVSRPQPGGSGSVIPHFHHSLWGGSLDHTGVGGGGSGGGRSPSSHHQHIPSGVVISNNNPVDVGGTQLGFHRPTQQGLSLTLSSSQQQQQQGYHHHHQSVSVVNTPIGILSPRNTTGLSGSSSSVSNGLPPGGFQSAVFGSKYLKAAQVLLDELVHVGKVDNSSSEKGKEKGKVSSSGLTAAETSQQPGQSDNKTTSLTTELTVAQRQELQMKKAKLVSMLDEVEQRYRQYHHQMQIVVASFEQAAGIGSARSYTQLALQTISKQFRCLKDAISSQIKSASKSLGEDHESFGGGKLEGSRLKFVDQQLRQQRALQQLGMMQNNTWRPQRGLPERAVSVLRAWLFEHFLHPYPKDTDKQMLAKQTGLTRSQVSNWFINARVRLWKPMVEEMYLEETKNQEQGGSETNKQLGSNSKNPKENNNAAAARIDQQENHPLGHDASHLATSSSSPTDTSPQAHRAGNFGLIEALNIEGSAEKNAKKLRSTDHHHHQMQNSPSSILSVDMEMKFGDTRKGPSSFNNGFGAFGLGELGQFNPGQLATAGFHGNSVSLTLGLPPSDHQNLPLSAAGSHHHHQQQNYLSEQMDQGHYDQRVNGKSQTPSSHPNMGYETINFDSRKRFATQLLQDFVT